MIFPGCAYFFNDKSDIKISIDSFNIVKLIKFIISKHSLLIFFTNKYWWRINVYQWKEVKDLFAVLNETEYILWTLIIKNEAQDLFNIPSFFFNFFSFYLYLILFHLFNSIFMFNLFNKYLRKLLLVIII